MLVSLTYIFVIAAVCILVKYNVLQTILL